MPYRPTPRTEAKRAEARERVVTAAHDLIAQGGYKAAPVAAVARGAGVATGSVYRHFPSKADLFAEVFRRASQREVDAMAQASAGDGPVLERLAAGVELGRGARCAAAAWPGRCWPSRSTRPSRPSDCTSAAPTATASPRSSARASTAASCPTRTPT